MFDFKREGLRLALIFLLLTVVVAFVFYFTPPVLSGQ